MAVDKLVNSTQLNTDLTSVANAIRTKGGTSVQLAFPAEFVAAINTISTGYSIDDIAERNISGSITVDSATVGNYAFAGCTGITDVMLPNVTSIGSNAFTGCTSLFKLHLENVSAVPTLANANAFDNTPLSASGNGSIYVPQSLYNSFISASQWSTVSARIVGYTPTSCKTVIYRDTTGNWDYVLIINEDPSDRAANMARFDPYGDYPDDVIVEEFPGLDEVNDYVFNNEDEVLWKDYASEIWSVEVGSTTIPTSTAYWFSSLGRGNYYGQVIYDLTNLDTSHVTDMSHMFEDAVDIKSPETYLTYEVLEQLDTSSVTNMENMFAWSGVQVVNLEVWGLGTGNVTNMSNMFYDCESLVYVSMWGLDLRAVQDMSNMFNYCLELSEVQFNDASDPSLNVRIRDVTNLFRMFYNCPQLESLDLREFSTSNVTNMAEMFYNCDALTAIIVSPSFVTTNVTTYGDMFFDCGNLVGGSGTAYSTHFWADEKEYARIDNPPSAPGFFTAAT